MILKKIVLKLFIQAVVLIKYETGLALIRDRAYQMGNYRNRNLF